MIAGSSGTGQRLLFQRAAGFRFLGFACLLVTYNNVAVATTEASSHARVAFEAGNAIAPAVVVAWALWVEKLRLVDLGFSLQGLKGSLVWGLVAGLAMGIPPLIFFAVPVVLQAPVAYGGNPLPEATSLIELFFFRVLVSTAVYEETLFRGFLHHLGTHRFGLRGGIAVSSGLFVLWHVVVTWQTIHQTNLTAAVLPVPALYVAAAVPLAGAGVIFSLVRHWTGNLAGAILAHWTVNSLMRGYFLLRAL